MNKYINKKIKIIIIIIRRTNKWTIKLVQHT